MLFRSSCLGLFTAAPSLEHPFSRSYGVNLPSSLTTLLPLALEFSSYLPVEWITAENGNESLCYYSLGNYVSTQKNALSMLEGMAWLTFHVAEDGVSIERKTTGVIPLVCQYTSGPVRFENVYLLEEYTEELAASHGIRNYAGVVLHLEDLQKWSDEILGDFILTKDQALHNFKTDSINQ